MADKRIQLSGQSTRQQDKRCLRTRTWIVQAFNELIFKRAYDGLQTALIVKRAGVGRSTFYEHFRSKDDVLLQSVSPILAALADAVTDAGDPQRIRAVVDHVLDQKPPLRIQASSGQPAPARQNRRTCRRPALSWRWTDRLCRGEIAWKL